MDYLVPQADGSRVCTNEALFQASRRRALVLPARNFWSGNFITQVVRGGERLPLTEARRVLVPSMLLARRLVCRTAIVEPLDRGETRRQARRGAMQQHVSETRRNAAALEITCSNVHRAIALVTQWLRSGYNIGYTGHAQQQHRQKRQTNRQRNKTHAATTRTAVCCSCCPPKNVYSITTLSKRARKVSPDEVSALHTDSSSEDHCVEMNLPCQRCINHESRFRISPAQPRLD